MKHNRFLAALLFGVAGVFLLAAGQPREWRTYRCEEFGYELQYPAGWKIFETPQREAEALYPGQLHKATFQEPEGKIWPGEFLVVVHERSDGLSLDDWADRTFTDVHDESLVSDAEDANLGGRPAKLFSVFGFDHTGIVVALLHEAKVYEIRFAGQNPNDPDIEEHRAVYQRMMESFVIAPTAAANAFDLGGPCAEGSGSTPPDLYSKISQASAAGDSERLIDLHKQSVRAMCSNHFRWLSLAETYIGADRPDKAIEVLHELHRRKAEIKHETFRDHPDLAQLIETPEFRQSELGVELRALRNVAAERKEAHRRKLEALDPAARPPERYVAEGACPFECCSYREWSVLETTSLYDAPFGSASVGTVSEGSKVKGVTGEVHLRPVPVAVIHDRPPLSRGEIIFVLDYLGEDFYSYWRNGEIAENELWADEFCLRPSRDCWAEYIEAPEMREDPQWWILIETADGVRGWTDRPEHFGNKDACG
jgi:hypothetical protein